MEAKDLLPENTLLIVIDVQEKLFQAVQGRSKIEKNIISLLKTCGILNVPILFFEQNNKGLGPTISSLSSVCEKKNVYNKMSFSIKGSEEFMTYCSTHKKLKNILICGIETHVCVFQSVRDLISLGYNVNVVEDAVSSRKESDHLTGLRRMELEGALPSTSEMVIFDLLQRCDRQEFKTILELVK